MFCSQLKKVNFVVCFGKNVPLYVDTVMFDENFRQQVLPRIEIFSKVLLFLSCSPVEFKDMKNCTNIIAEKINKKEKNGYFISHTHKKWCVLWYSYKFELNLMLMTRTWRRVSHGGQHR